MMDWMNDPFRAGGGGKVRSLRGTSLMVRTIHDSVLKEAIDAIVDKVAGKGHRESVRKVFARELREKLYARAEIGWILYGMAWHDKTIAELEKDLEEEKLDAMVYQAMIDYKRKNG